MIAKTAQIGYKEHGGKIFIHPTANVLEHCIIRSCTGIINIGAHSSIGYYSIIHGLGGVSIGNNVLISPNVQIYAQNHGILKGSLIAKQKQTAKGITIQDGVWVGAGSIILDGITIGYGAVVGAGSVVTKSIPDNEIWAGNPAKKIGIRK